MRLVDTETLFEDLHDILYENGHIRSSEMSKVAYIIECQPTVNPNPWILCSERLPVTTNIPFDSKVYLVKYDVGGYSVIGYHDGWNCSLDFNGNVRRDSEMFTVVAWKEIED